MEKLKKRTMNTRGFTLAETLITVAIISLVCTGLVGISGVVRNIYRKVTLEADAETLMATTVTALKEDMSSANNVVTNGNVLKFYSTARGCQMYYAKEPDTDNGIKVVLVAGDGSETTLPLVTKKTMPHGLYTQISNIKYTKGLWSFDVLVTDNGDVSLPKHISVRSYNDN